MELGPKLERELAAKILTVMEAGRDHAQEHFSKFDQDGRWDELHTMVAREWLDAFVASFEAEIEAASYRQSHSMRRGQ